MIAHRPARSDRPTIRLPRLLLLVTSVLLISLIVPPHPAPAAVLPVTADTDILLVQPTDGIAIDALAGALTELGYAVVDGGQPAGAVRISVQDGDDPLAIADAIAASGLARGVEPDGFVRTARIPDGALVDQQLTYLNVIRAPEAWEHTTGDGTTVIAIVDTGLDYNHPEFRGRLAINGADYFADGIDNDRNGCIDDIAGCNFVTPLSADPSCGYKRAAPNWFAWDDAGHGTVVAGVAAATGDDGSGVAGLSWDALLLPVKVLDCTGVGRISTAAEGIRYAAERGAHIINISLGTTSNSRVLHEAVLAAQASGALIVASAGNTPGVVTYPGAYHGVIAVGASGYKGVGSDPDYTRITSFSGNGPELDLIAPGYRVTGPLPANLCNTPSWSCIDGQYTVTSGSSFAAAIVSGAAALLRAEHPGLSGPLQSSLLLQSLQLASDGSTSLLDVAAALEYPVFQTHAPGTVRTNDEGSAGPGG
jgi:subtilisin family serine protease